MALQFLRPINRLHRTQLKLLGNRTSNFRKKIWHSLNSLNKTLVGVITLNNPPLNALTQTRGLLQEIKDHLVAGEADDNIKAFVLIGANRNFSAGADISEFGKPNDPTQGRSAPTHGIHGYSEKTPDRRDSRPDHGRRFGIGDGVSLSRRRAGRVVGIAGSQAGFASWRGRDATFAALDRRRTKLAHDHDRRSDQSRKSGEARPR